MFVTSEILERANSCEKGKAWFAKHYPDGAELSELITHRHMTKSFLHWGRDHLSPSEEEIALYEKVLCNENSNSVFHSDHIVNSNVVVESTQVMDSNNIFKSSNIKNSIDIAACDTVENSQQIFVSNFIYHCQKIFNGNNINDSQNVANCTYIVNSKNVFDSKVISFCAEIRNSQNLKDCYFCNNCANLRHCFGCEGLTAGEYYVFNQPVEPELFEVLKSQYLSIMTCLFEYTENWPMDMITLNVPNITNNFIKHYHSIPAKFWKWIKTLPNYSNEFMFRLTCLPEFLTK